MQTSHLNALNEKHEKLEQSIHEETTHPARNTVLIERLKKEKLHLKEKIEHVKKTCK
ncbi:MAG: DUF465 domain-containing protein [Alphaproteobacteria bacterium]|nr:DUF465 domain-containing protein [Alphaproteobacteria bacterium]MCK5517862.1 DUF465 domain-containing protein [Alphaproteobacteria bacterium]MCK5556270.1 DUF465 domain-containing protein [Alphaproteobacteria bacterium]MCK5659165.1 DUF465 domain-containing protein [Alphaproteobacteria bacterium]